MDQKEIMDRYWSGTLKVTNKPLMYWLMRRYLLGNSLRIFDTEEDLKKSDVKVCGVRCVGRPGLPCIPWIEPDIAFDTARNLEAIHGAQVLVVECDKYLDRSIQGEIQIRDGRLEFFYTYNKKYMRQALKEDPNSAVGNDAEYLLKKHLNTSSYEDIQILLERFPEHVIEFTAYKECVGYFTGRNYTCWEVRLY